MVKNVPDIRWAMAIHGFQLLLRLYSHFHVNPDNDICVTVVRVFFGIGSQFRKGIVRSILILKTTASFWVPEVFSIKSFQTPFGPVQGHLRCVGEAARMATWTTLESNSFASHCCLFWCRRELQHTCGCCRLPWYFLCFMIVSDKYIFLHEYVEWLHKILDITRSTTLTTNTTLVPGIRSFW